MIQGEKSKPTRLEVTETLTRLITEIADIPADKITDSAAVDDELQMQSIAFVELQVAIEDEYHIQLDPIHLVELNRFGAIADYVYLQALKGEG